jgi:ketosteroid isomerase-like protein
VEAEVCGAFAWCRTHLTMTITPPNGKSMRRSGYTLSILRKGADGRWVMFRDANLLAAESPSP